MNKTIFCFIFLIFLSQVVCANVLEVDFSIGSDNVVNLNEMRVKDNVLPTPVIPSGEYALQILDSSGNILTDKGFNVNFCVLSDPPICSSDATSVYFAFEYSEGMKVFKLFHNGIEIFQTNIALCNNDGNCDGSVLFASAIEKIGMNPYIMLVPGHAFVCWDIKEDTSTVDCLETTMVNSGSYEQAEETALTEYNEEVTKGDFESGVSKLISIKKMREEMGIMPMS